MWMSRIRDVIKNASPDVVLTQQTVVAPSVEICREFGIKSVVFIQNVDPFCLGSFWSGHPWKCRYRCIGCKDSGPRLLQYPFFLSHIRKFRMRISGSDAIIANSEFMRRTLDEILGVDSVVIEPVTGFVGSPLTPTTSGKILLFSPVDYKGVDLALEVAGMMRNEMFRFVGNAKRRTVERISSAENVEYVPWVKDPSEVYSDAKLLIVPSVIPEGFGMVCVEAMSRGIPCVVSDVGALPETIGFGGDSVSPHSDPSAWVSILRRYSRDAYLLEKSRLATERSKSYSPGKSIDTLSALLERVMNPTMPELRAPR
jgi:glycosyltransferase involved in cell wall biosynthesis